jgi:hypothetical protein
MPRRNDISKILVVSSVLCFLPELDAQRRARSNDLTAECGTTVGARHERVFSNAGGKKWNEYPDTSSIPPLDLDTGERAFSVATNRNGGHYVRTVEYGEDSSTFQTSCFGATGRLESLHYEMRTAWGWGYEDRRSFSKQGGLLRHTSRFFDTESNKTIRRPEGADDVPGFLKPVVYKSFDSLPFIETFRQRADATPQ